MGLVSPCAFAASGFDAPVGNTIATCPTLGKVLTVFNLTAKGRPVALTRIRLALLVSPIGQRCEVDSVIAFC